MLSTMTLPARVAPLVQAAARALGALGWTVLAATAQAAPETLACPDPGALVRVGSCASEEQLRYTFTGFCSSNQRLYGRDADVCTDFESYRRAKDTVLVESSDGLYQGYLACRLDPATLAAVQPLRMSVSRKGPITQVVCEGDGGLRLVHRTRSSCAVVDPERCRTDARDCAARCDSTPTGR